MTAAELSPYTPGIEQYQTGIIMDAAGAKALDDKLRAATRAVLREGTDYGVIPGTNGDKTLKKPGAEKLLQWFGLGFTCDRTEIEHDEAGRKLGVTYRCVITKRLADGSTVTVTTCEGYAGYDEDRFYQTAEQVQRKAETSERRFAEKDRRPARPTRWEGLPEYRAPWNTVIKMAQKRAIVGATIDATAAAGLFSQEDDDAPADADGVPSWYEQALEAALTFTAKADGSKLIAEAARAARDGLCTPGQATHIQNRAAARLKLLRTAAPVDVEDLGRQEPAADEPDARDDAPRPATSGQLAMLGQRLGKLGVEDENRLGTLEKLAGRDLAAAADLTRDEALSIKDALDKCQGDRGALVELLATGELPAAGETAQDDG